MVYVLAWEALAVVANAAVVESTISIHSKMLLARALERLSWENIIITC